MRFTIKYQSNKYDKQDLYIYIFDGHVLFSMLPFKKNNFIVGTMAY